MGLFSKKSKDLAYDATGARSLSGLLGTTAQPPGAGGI